jgi:hypothetical protein
MRKCLIALACAAVLAAGCASYDGRTLIPGSSSAAEVEATMGRPAERIERTGESIWWYPRGPMGFHTYAVRMGADGVLRDIEQRLTVENLKRLAVGRMTRQEVRELLGPPFLITELPLREHEVWEYQLLEYDFKWKLWVQFSRDGVLREVLQMRHPDMDPPGGDKD